MNITNEFIFINPEIDEIKSIINNTMKDYNEKYGYGYWRKLECLYNTRFFDKRKNKTKNITTKQGVKRTIKASKGTYENIEMKKFINLLERDIRKNFFRIYMKCGNIPLL